MRLLKPCVHDWYEEHWFKDEAGKYPVHCVGGTQPTAQDLLEALADVKYIGHYLPIAKVPNGRLADELRERGMDVKPSYLEALGCIPWEMGDMPAEVAIRRGRDGDDDV